MSEDFYPFVDSGDPAPDNTHLAPSSSVQPNEQMSAASQDEQSSTTPQNLYSLRIAVYDDMLSTPRVIVVEQTDVRTYLEDVTNTVYRAMKEQGGHLTLMIIRELVENYIHAHFSEPVISILDNGDTIRFADQGPGITDKERAFEFGVTSATQEQKRYIRGTGAGLPMIQQYVENAGGVISIEDNLGQGTVITVSVNPERVAEIEHTVSRGAAVRSRQMPTTQAQNTVQPQPVYSYPMPQPTYQQPYNQFSTIPQQYPQPAFSYRQQGFSPQAPTAPQTPYISERGLLALRFIWENSKGGPTDLTRAFGNSNGTWSRELDTLSRTGFVHKPGQKYVLTDMGKAWIRQHQL